MRMLAVLGEGDLVATIPRGTPAAAVAIEGAGLGGPLVLAIVVMYECMRGSESLWNTYLHLLPECEPVPLIWPADKAERLLASTELDKLPIHSSVTGGASNQAGFRLGLYPSLERRLGPSTQRKAGMGDGGGDEERKADARDGGGGEERKAGMGDGNGEDGWLALPWLVQQQVLLLEVIWLISLGKHGVSRWRLMSVDVDHYAMTALKDEEDVELKRLAIEFLSNYCSAILSVTGDAGNGEEDKKQKRNASQSFLVPCSNAFAKQQRVAPCSGLETLKFCMNIAKLPLYSVGHSNGVLLQLLVGSYFSEKIPKANAIVSFNNRPASEAVPYSEQEFNVTEGVSEFKPTPLENREFCKDSYSVPNTLLVKFSIDAIDDTNIVEEVLRPWVDSIGGQIKKVILSGTHQTPCIQDVKWQVGLEYTLADALAQGLKSLALNETRILSRTIADWFRSL
ncbi:hypothetical protein ABZP36_010324 [Zizania latifolia]